MNDTSTKDIICDQAIDSYKDIDILYHDDHLLLVNKPADLLTVPGKGPDKADCMISRLQEKWSRANVVHRLDMATSGILVVALTPTAHRELSKQFQNRETSKEYIAVIYGELEPGSGTVDLPLITDWPNRPRQKVCHESGKPSQTLWQIIPTPDTRTPIAQSTRVKLTPITGRSHQLRVHMLSLGHPIIGDNLYGCDTSNAMAPRLLLHARKLTIKHPVTEALITAIAEAEF